MATTNSAAKILMSNYLCDMLTRNPLSKYPGVKLLNHMIDLFLVVFFLFRNPILIFIMTEQGYIPSEVYNGYFLSTFLLLFIFFKTAILSRLIQNFNILRICICLIASKVEHACLLRTIHFISLFITWVVLFLA